MTIKQAFTLVEVTKGGRLMKKLNILLMSLVLAGCGGSDDPFAEVTIDINVPPLLPEIVETPTIRINSASTSGAGCPSGSSDVTVSNDARTLSVLFDEFEALAGIGSGVDGGADVTTRRVACNIAISLHIPTGYQAFLIGADFRGAVSLPPSGIAEFNREYFFASAKSPVLTSTWSGEVDNEDIDISDDLYADSFSHHRCGEDVILRSNTSLYITAPATADTALIQMDSLDYENTQHKTQFDYQFSYEKCS